MVQRLNEAGIACELWCSGDACSWFGALDSGANSLPTRHLPTELSPNPFRSLVRMVRLLTWLAHARPQVVHAHLFRSALLPLIAAWLVGVPVRVYHNHGLSHLGYRGILGWALRILERLNRTAATHVLMVSTSNLGSAQASGLMGHMTVLAHGSAVGLDPARFDEHHCGPELRQAMRARLNIGKDALVVGFGGRAAAHKGLDVLMTAWSQSRLAETGAVVCLAGVRAEELKRLAGSIPIGVHCLGPLPDMAPFYALCDMIVLPSRYEGFSYTLLEGAAAGLPCIGSDVSGIRCGIENNITGLLVPHGDTAALARSLLCLAGDAEMRQRFGQAGRNRVRERFTRKQVLNALVDYYRDVLGIGHEGRQ